MATMMAMMARSLETTLRGALVALLLVGVGATRAQAQMAPPPDFLLTVPSAHDFDETVALLTQAIATELRSITEAVVASVR